MGENIKVKEQPHTAETLREQIRDTESHITETVERLEERLSPRALRQRGVRNAKRAAWITTAKVLEFAQHTAVQASVVGGSLLLLLVRNRKVHGKAHSRPAAKSAVPEKTGTAALALGATALQRLMRRKEDRAERTAAKLSARRPAVSRIGLAVTAIKAFLTGARASVKSGTARPGRRVAWRSLATTIGAALGSYWYSHRGRRTARAR